MCTGGTLLNFPVLRIQLPPFCSSYILYSGNIIPTVERIIHHLSNWSFSKRDVQPMRAHEKDDVASLVVF